MIRIVDSEEGPRLHKTDERRLQAAADANKVALLVGYEDFTEGMYYDYEDLRRDDPDAYERKERLLQRKSGVYLELSEYPDRDYEMVRYRVQPDGMYFVQSYAPNEDVEDMPYWIPDIETLILLMPEFGRVASTMT